MPRSASDIDTAWKEMIERWFPAFFEFFFPDVYQEIDWSREPEFLDKELSYAVRMAGRGRRSVDKLARVYLKDGKDTWALAHIEAQSQKEETFSKRMFICNTLLFARHDRPVASFAVLGDPVQDWRPDSFGYSQWGSGADAHFRDNAGSPEDTGYPAEQREPVGVESENPGLRVLARVAGGPEGGPGAVPRSDDAGTKTDAAEVRQDLEAIRGGRKNADGIDESSRA